MAETLGTTFSPVLWVNTDCLPSMIDSVVNHCLRLTDGGELYAHLLTGCAVHPADPQTLVCMLSFFPQLPLFPALCLSNNKLTHTHTDTHTLLCTQGSQSWLNKLTCSSQVSAGNTSNYKQQQRKPSCSRSSSNQWCWLKRLRMFVDIMKTEWHQM